MSISKKLLSLLLCAVMLFGVVAIGLSASAEDTPVSEGSQPVAERSYSDLSGEYGSNPFVYIALRFYETDPETNTETLLAPNASLVSGQNYIFKVFLKSNQSVYKNAWINIALDNDFFDFTTTNSGTSGLSASYLGSKGTLAAAKKAYADGTAYTEIKQSTGYTDADITSWGGLKIVYNSSNTAKTPTSDDPVFVGKATVKTDLAEGVTGGQALTDASFYTNIIGWTDSGVKKYNNNTTGVPQGKIPTSANDKFATTSFICDGKYNFVLDAKYEVSYTYEDGTTAAPSQQVAGGDPVPLPEVENLYAWYYNNAPLESGTTVNGAMTLVAVLKSRKINITLSAPEGTVNGQSEVIIQQSITEPEVSLSGYSAVFNDGSEFGGWKDAQGEKYTTTYTVSGLDDVTLTAFKKGSMDIVVQSVNYDEDSQNYVYGYETITTITGEVGTPVSLEEYDELVEYCAEHQADIANLSGIKTLPLAGEDDTREYKLSYTAYGNTTDNIVTTRPDDAANKDSYFAYENGSNVTLIKTKFFSKTGSVKFGTISRLILNTAVVFNIDIYTPEFDGEGNVVESAEGKYGIKWKDPGTATAVYSGIKEGYAGTATNAPVLANNAHAIYPAVDVSTYTAAIDTNRYQVVFKDGNDQTIEQTNGAPKVLYANTDNSNPNHVSLYIDVEEKPYYVGFYTDRNGGTSSKAASYTKVYYGDTITLETFDKITTDVARVISGNELGQFDFADLFEDGTAAGNPGYKLKRVYLETDDGDINITDEGTSITLDADFIGTYAGGTSPYVYFKTEWEAKDYTVEFYYLDSSSNWTLAGEPQHYTGSQVLTYAMLVDDDLKALIEENCPDSLAPLAGNISLESEITGEGNTAVASVNTTQADESEDGVLRIYAAYNTSQRTAFVDYNNGKNKEGEINEDFSGDMRYEVYVKDFGYALMDPSYDVEEQGLDDEPIFDQKIRTTNPPTMPEPATDVDPKGTFDKNNPRPYRNCEFMGFKTYYVDGVYSAFEDLPPVEEWKEGCNDRNEEGAQHLYTTSILQMQWKADSDFLFRVYDDSNTLMWAIDKKFHKYYWAPTAELADDTNAIPATKADIVHCRLPEENIVILFLPKFPGEDSKEDSFYFYHLSIGKSFLNLNTYGRLIPMIIDALKSGDIAALLG
ncbi:MAG: hypothetical protein IJM02_01270 [Clostridia bacterium]|nr:hypothetical protein [Clostridia bacterium]